MRNGTAQEDEKLWWMEMCIFCPRRITTTAATKTVENNPMRQITINFDNPPAESLIQRALKERRKLCIHEIVCCVDTPALFHSSFLSQSHSLIACNWRKNQDITRGDCCCCDSTSSIRCSESSATGSGGSGQLFCNLHKTFRFPNRHPLPDQKSIKCTCRNAIIVSVEI